MPSRRAAGFLGSPLMRGAMRRGPSALAATLFCMHTLTQRLHEMCVSAWNKDPVFGVIGVQSGPPH